MQLARKRSFLTGISIPKTFRYIGVKFIRNRGTCQDISKGDGFQLSRLEFFNSTTSEIFDIRTSVTKVSLFARTKGKIAYCAHPNLTVDNYDVYEGIAKLFDQSVSTKLCRCSSNIPSLEIKGDPYWVDEQGNVLAKEGDNNHKFLEYWDLQDTGVTNGQFPVLMVLDLQTSRFDPLEYDRWRFYNANDNNSQPNRTWVEGEIIASDDNQNWFTLDYFMKLNIVNTNYALAYTGNLEVKKTENQWKHMDMMDYIV